MVPTNAIELAEALRQSDLLSRQQLAQIAPLISQVADPQELAFALVQRGWLTSYQAEQSLAGKASELVIGGCTLLEPIGSGGMGLVLKGIQKRLNRTVAVKLIRPDVVSKNVGAIRRFRREAMAVAQLSHPNIVIIYDADEVGEINYLVMEYVDGPDLGRLVGETGPLPVTMAAEFIRQAALGLQHAYEAGLVHRDIKPSNLLVARRDSIRKPAKESAGPNSGWHLWWDSVAQGIVKILDMGLARSEAEIESQTSLTREGAMLGTPDFVAPEQARDASSADIRADIYSLGCTFYFLLTGRPPFPEGTAIEKLVKHQIEQPAPIEQLRPDVPASVAGVMRKMMAKDASRRYQQPTELADALAEVLTLPALHGLGPAVTVGALTPTPTPSPPTPPTFPRAPNLGDPYSILQPSANLPPATPSSHGSTLTEQPVAVVTAHSLQQATTDTTVEDVSPVEARKIAVLRAHSGPVMALAFAPDCRSLATGGLDRSLRVWYLSQPPREQALLQEPLLGDLQRLAFSPNGQTIVTGAASFDDRMWCWHWRKPLRQDRFTFDGAPSYSDSVAFSPDGAVVASAVGESVWCWTMTEDAPRKKTVIRTEGADVRMVAFRPEHSNIVTGHADGAVQIWKAGWLGSRPIANLDGHSDCITCLAFSSDSALLASAAKDHTVRIWDGAGASKKAKAIIPEIRGIVRQMLFLPDSQYLLTISDAGQAVVWTWIDGGRVCEWKLSQSIICSLALSNDGGTVAAGSSDGTVTLYDLAAE